MYSDNPFERVHKLFRKKRYDVVLRTMLDADTFKLRKVYKVNSNHAWYLIGDALFKTKKLELARNAFQKSVKALPSDSEALWALGNTYSELGRHKLAERFFNRALKLDPKNSALIFNLGNALFDQRRFEAALAVYKKIPASQTRYYKLARKNIRISISKI